MRACHDCGAPSRGFYCPFDFALLMKEMGFENAFIRQVYAYALAQEAGAPPASEAGKET